MENVHNAVGWRAKLHHGQVAGGQVQIADGLVLALADAGELVLDLLRANPPHDQAQVAASIRAASRIGGDVALRLIGDLTINGVTRSVALDLDGPTPPQTMQGKTISGFSASGTIKRSDFSFGAKFPPPLVGDEVKFTIDVEIDKQ